MSMNKFMHPRNIYITPPNFKELAINYPEFRKHAKQELSGKISINFKDPAALRALTKTLLLKDFDLTVDIPLNRLVPTLPLRVNYLLWIEDLLQASNLGNSAEIYGIDIGTGASCIYPLLSAKTKGWRMLATDIDEGSVACAKRNVQLNCLKHLIEVKKVERGMILNGVIEDGKKYTFSMCNPPFFGSDKEVIASDNRSKNRAPPSNSLTGTIGELVVEGGEVTFIRNMLHESAYLGKRVSLYTTMVGHKSNVMLLKTEMAGTGACSVGSYELCQGRTTRWVLAWTFNGGVKTAVDGLVAHKKSLAKPPFRYVLPRKNEHEYTVDAYFPSVKEILLRLEMEYIEIKRSKNILIYEITAWKDTWSKQRRKRRAAAQEKRRISFERPMGSDNKDYELNSSLTDVHCKESAAVGLSSTQSYGYDKRPQVETDPSVQQSSEEYLLYESTALEVMKDEKGGVPFLKASLVIRNVSSEIFLELAWLEGLSGRDALHQVLQFFKNSM